MQIQSDISANKYASKIASIFIVFGIFLFAPAGTLNWPEAWALFLTYLIWMLLQVNYINAKDPELVKIRMDSSTKNSKTWDNKIIKGITILFFSIIFVAGLDAVRYRWSSVPFIIKLIAFLCLIPTLIWHLWIMRENTFLSTRVEIQKGRDHKVITTGPYKFVRHPMYAANMFMYLCMPLVLGSLYALIPSVLLIALFIERTRREDKMLIEELQGYKEYTEKVRFRLFPHVW